MPKVRTPRVPSITDLVRPMERLAAFHLVEHGIPARLAAGAAARFGISKERLVEVLGISRPTLNRLEREGGSFGVVTGDVFKDVVVVLNKALAMLGHNKQALGEWLREPALGRAPLDLLKTKDGRDLVSNLLDRAYSGAYS